MSKGKRQKDARYIYVGVGGAFFRKQKQNTKKNQKHNRRPNSKFEIQNSTFVVDSIRFARRIFGGETSFDINEITFWNWNKNRETWILLNFEYFEFGIQLVDVAFLLFFVFWVKRPRTADMRLRLNKPLI